MLAVAGQVYRHGNGCYDVIDTVDGPRKDRWLQIAECKRCRSLPPTFVILSYSSTSPSSLFCLSLPRSLRPSAFNQLSVWLAPSSPPLVISHASLPPLFSLSPSPTPVILFRSLYVLLFFPPPFHSSRKQGSVSSDVLRRGKLLYIRWMFIIDRLVNSKQLFCVILLFLFWKVHLRH